MSKIYVTTAIPYVNGAPHIGHVMDYLLADTYYRYHTKLGDEVRFQTGTDEHGNKVFAKAKAAGIDVSDYASQNSQKFKDLIALLNVKPTGFIRTTDKDHERRCQEIWKKLESHIYKSSYEGWYCEGCENFVTQKEYDENNGVCPDHQKPYQKISEENYYLRISDFKDKIIKAIQDDELLILPDFRKKEILELLKDTPDVSVSRPVKSLSWGVPIPDDDSQVMYVWIDALSNYITALGYPENDISDFWPADAQFVGKDILRFHTIIWPAMLMGLGLPLPKVICSHGFILANGQKMSKSLGNVVDPIEAINKHGVDAFRYYFLRHIDTFVDSDFTWDKFEDAYNNELANDLGNLVQRLATLANKNNIVIDSTEEIAIDTDRQYSDFMNLFEFSKAFDYAWEKVQNINKRIDVEKPWEIAKNGTADQLKECLTSLIKELLFANELLSPFLPGVTEKISTIFKAGQEIIPPKTPLFPKN